MSSHLDNVLVFEDLQRITGYQRRYDVEKSLAEQGIRFFRGRRGPWTTIDLINYAGGITATNSGRYSADIL